MHSLLFILFIFKAMKCECLSIKYGLHNVDKGTDWGMNGSDGSLYHYSQYRVCLGGRGIWPLPMLKPNLRPRV